MAGFTSSDFKAEPLSDSPNGFSAADGRTLLEVARQSLWRGVHHGCAEAVDPQMFEASVRVRRGVFVTLKRDEALRGCIGTLEPVRTLVEDVARNAFAAGFRDPRFSPVALMELNLLSVSLSVLTEPTEMAFDDERSLLEQVQPGIDGLILEANGHRGTFLPAVWESVPEPGQFLAELKRKAGLADGPLPGGAKVWRYAAETIV